MHNRTLADLDQVVALGGGHGLGRVMSALSSLGSRLTGIVTTTDNGGSSGRIRKSEGGIAWGDTRNCLNQLIVEPSIASAMFEYRFDGQGELAGHHLGNLMLKALDNLSVRPLEAVNFIRHLLKVNASLIPMSEHPIDLLAITASGEIIYGEVAVDRLRELPAQMKLSAVVPATREALQAITDADLIIIGPGSFLTSLMPLLLLDDLTQALRHTSAPMIYLDNLGRELSIAAANLSLIQKVIMMEQAIGREKVINGMIIGPGVTSGSISERIVIQLPLVATGEEHYHDRTLLRQALDVILPLLD
ncbi:uridine diphosphate-N-acetylglucosamine-binding protein YvcK [Candidatus Palibaumannia cicadellinicola]|uniref:Putative gluconeogenesis factor n=1 Tax=Candidatus Palibaumannia cicadellinicola TaxID=186490 RepID=A0A088MXS3_9GAMM|nr:uridine diphosphate-N-acetylglucosamine-binding protein YvcK [Candidatus Baumannia cicadellinicola]AIN47160.1 putative transferase with NAD(P)-binding Rossmann-fold domain [Candidatus Baumannia cicadellinicola]